MAAQVFAHVLAEDVERHRRNLQRAWALAEPPSPERYGLWSRPGWSPRSGSRGPGRSHRIYDDDVWSAITMQRLPLLRRWEEGTASQISLLDANSQGAKRMRETQAHFRFMSTELPKLMERWDKDRENLIQRSFTERTR